MNAFGWIYQPQITMYWASYLSPCDHWIDLFPELYLLRIIRSHMKNNVFSHFIVLQEPLVSLFGWEFLTSFKIYLTFSLEFSFWKQFRFFYETWNMLKTTIFFPFMCGTPMTLSFFRRRSPNCSSLTQEAKMCFITPLNMQHFSNRGRNWQLKQCSASQFNSISLHCMECF